MYWTERQIELSAIVCGNLDDLVFVAVSGTVFNNRRKRNLKGAPTCSTSCFIFRCSTAKDTLMHWKNIQGFNLLPCRWRQHSWIYDAAWSCLTLQLRHSSSSNVKSTPLSVQNRSRFIKTSSDFSILEKYSSKMRKAKVWLLAKNFNHHMIIVVPMSTLL
jgi:hypothetical protein